MNGLATLFDHWGYAAIFAVVVLGNVGLPVAEEIILTLAASTRGSSRTDDFL
jgi:membrane protein DedA with SNARE-associated domain